MQAVLRLAAYYMRSPDGLSQEEVRAYLLHLRDECGVARGTFKTNQGCIRFLFHRTLEPTVLSHAEARTILAHVRNPDDGKGHRRSGS